MRAVRVHEFGGPESLRVDAVDDPRPRPDQVLVRIRAAGVNPIDTYVRGGTHSIRPQLPYVPGFDGAGEVVEGGAGPTSGFSPGTRVRLTGAASGTYAEYALGDVGQVHVLPDHVTFAQGAAVGIPYVTAYRALFQAGRARAGETVLVRGASGGVGLAAVQLGWAAGMTMIGTASTDSGRTLVQAQGAHYVLDHGGPDFYQSLQHMTGGSGADVILEMRADKNLGEDLQLLAPRGRVVIVGSRGRVEINPRDAMVREAAICSVFFFNARPAELNSIHAALSAALALRVARPVVAREFPLDQARQAHEAVMASGALGKIVIIL